MEANGLVANLSDSQCIASFQTIRNFFKYMSGLSKKLQGSSLDVLEGYRMVAHVREVISGLIMNMTMSSIAWRRWLNKQTVS